MKTVYDNHENNDFATLIKEQVLYYKELKNDPKLKAQGYKF